MKAYTIQNGFGIENLSLVDCAEPAAPNPKEILVRVRAVSLNYRDLMTVEGTYNPKQPLPLIPCSDAAGEVVTVGSEVSRFEIGDRVSPIFCQDWVSGKPNRENLRSTLGGPLQGTLAQFILADEEGLVRVPDHLSDEEASTLPCAAVTAWNALVVQSEVGPDATVLVQGGGGVSTYVLLFAKLLGARVLVISSSEERIERLKELGADAGLLRTQGWGESVQALTHGKGVDVIVEVAGAESLSESLRAVAIGGTIVLVGVVSGCVSQVRLASIFMRHVRIQGIVVGSRDHFEDMNRRIEEHQLRPVLDRVFGFEEAVEAFRYFSKGGHIGKVCVRCDG